MTLKYLSVLFFPRWCATLVLRTVSRHRIWTFWKAIRHCRHVFLLPAKDTAVLKLLLIEQKCKPIKWSVLCDIMQPLRMTPSWRSKTKMAASSFVSMRNFWKEFSLPELQVSDQSRCFQILLSILCYILEKNNGNGCGVLGLRMCTIYTW